MARSVAFVVAATSAVLRQMVVVYPATEPSAEVCQSCPVVVGQHQVGTKEAIAVAVTALVLGRNRSPDPVAEKLGIAVLEMGARELFVNVTIVVVLYRLSAVVAVQPRTIVHSLFNPSAQGNDRNVTYQCWWLNS